MVAPLCFLTPDEITSIHTSTLRVLSEVGIMLEDEHARELFFSSGAKEHHQRICLPPELVEKCLEMCPPEVALWGRGGEVMLGNGSLHIHNLGGARDVYEPQSGNFRPATARDVAESARLLDSLENVSTVTPLYTPRDVPPEAMVVMMFAQTIRNTLKPINGPGVRNPQETRLLVEMMKVVFGLQPRISLGASPVSPLNFLGDIPQVMMEVARAGLPFGPLPCPNVGATSPMTLAGSLVQQNAECLASIVLVQLTHPGLPVIYCGRLSVLNMRSGTPIWGNPEMGMMSAATVQIGHFYHLPVNVYGLAGSGYAPDIQSGYERAINALVPALAGADELSGVGEMAGGSCSSNAQIVIDNDIYGMVKRVKNGIVIDEDRLAVPVIANAMDTTRNFLMEQHTRKYLRQGEVWSGRLNLHESGFEMWEAAGNPTAVDRAQQEAERLLKNHIVPPLSDEQNRALDEILASLQPN